MEILEEELMGPIKGRRVCRDVFEEVMTILDDTVVNEENLRMALLKYRVVQEDCPLLHDVKMPQIYSDIINARLSKKGLDRDYSV
jgi:hypothetical protein